MFLSRSRLAGFIALALAVTSAKAAPASTCKCSPTDSCWPSTSTWSSFNKTVSGNLLKTTPVAAPCYAGPNYNAATCANVVAGWTDSVYQADQPIGYSYPHTQQCDIPGGNTTVCSIGDDPVYAVNATCVGDVVSTIKYAAKNNVRLVVKTTGHDLIGRSTGAGSLELWLRHLREGVSFSSKYKPSTKCSASTWTGSSITVGGGYSWSDVYPVAEANNVIVVGGGCPSVSAIGGYMQGGGHSLANHAFGLAADQLLEATVVLASGDIVTASACQNTDLYTAIRGGGPGTYGVVVSGIIKAYPETKVTAQVFEMAPLTPANIPQFMEAVNILYQSFPALSDGGLSGYGNWFAYSPVPFINGAYSGLQYSLGAFGKSVADVTTLFAPVAAKLAPYNGTSLFISTSYLTFNSYFEYYYALNGVNSAAQSYSALVSRLFGKSHLGNTNGLKTMLNATAGGQYDFTFNEIALVGGGAVLDSSDKFSGVNPAWRQTYLMSIVARGWLDTTDYATTVAIHSDITNVKGAAMTKLAPDTGSYMNEGDFEDPNYLVNYYGAALPAHKAAKAKYDPNGVFYCPTCVGSDAWTVTNGELCKI